jgi:hypothetical protein
MAKATKRRAGVKAARRAGRPIKPVIGVARVSLGLKVTTEVKRTVEALAVASGRSQSQEMEFLVERALQYERTLRSLGSTLASLETDNIEAALARKGWRLVHMLDQHGNSADLWAPPGHPWNPRSGFLSDEELNTWGPDGVSQKAKEKAEREKQSEPER